MPGFFRSLFSLEGTSGWSSEEKAFNDGVLWERQRRKDERRARHALRAQKERDNGYEGRHGHRHYDESGPNHQRIGHDEYNDEDDWEYPEYQTGPVEDWSSERSGHFGDRYGIGYVGRHVDRKETRYPEHSGPREEESDTKPIEHQSRHVEHGERDGGPRHDRHCDSEDAVSGGSHWQSPGRFDYQKFPGPAESPGGSRFRPKDYSPNLPSGASNSRMKQQSRKYIDNALPRRRQDPEARARMDSLPPSESVSVMNEKRGKVAGYSRRNGGE